MPEDYENWEEEKGNQPLRERFENLTDRIPQGPAGKVGGGNLIGASGFVAVEATKPLWTFVPGIKQPGYKLISHSGEYIGDNMERHKVTVAALSEDVAEFVAEYVSSPGNIDYLRAKTISVEVDEIIERSTYDTYKITVILETNSTKGGVNVRQNDNR